MNEITLPEQFIRRMKERLGDGFSAFLDSFNAPAESAFHCNPLRTDLSLITPYLASLSARPIPGIKNGFYYSAEGIGKHSLHHAGLLYSQDPAAQLPTLCANMFPGIRILDLCAAPGGKTSQLAIACTPYNGTIVANEPHPERNRILRQNIERMGYRNLIVTQADPEELAPVYPEYFDLILVDAPCSGEGMFRKYPESIAQWSPENVSACASRQERILDAACSMLAPGGQLIYSTCTYAPEEDEQQVEHLIRRHGLSPLPLPEEVTALTSECESGSRIFYPHLGKGEGQFLASLQKPGTLPDHTEEITAPLPPAGKKLLDAASECLSASADLSGLYLIENRNRIIILPEGISRLPERCVTSYGVILGGPDERGKRFLPHHQFFRAYPERFLTSADIEPDAPELAAYLNGQELRESDTLPVRHPVKGYGVLRTLSAGVGGFRYADGRLKNLYPKGLRNP